MALPRAAHFLLLALLLFSSYSARSQPAPAPISLAPSALLHPDSLAPSQPPSAAADDTALSPPAPPETSPLPSPSESPAAPAHLHSAAPAPAPAAEKGDDSKDRDGDDKKEKEHPSPAPAPHAEEIKAGTGGEHTADADQSERHEGEMNGGKKAAVVVGAFTAAAVVGLAAVVWRKRQANVRRSRYADYSARLELV